MNNSIAAIILTYNEEKHISRCINSLKNICEEIFVIDSFSKDRTKIKAFRSQLRGVADLKFFMFRLARLYA